MSNMSTDRSSKRKAPAKEIRPAKKTKTSEKANPGKVNAALKEGKSRKQAAETDEATIVEPETAPKVSASKSKKVKIADKVEDVPTSISRSETSRKQKPISKALVVAEEEEIELPADDEEEDVAALLAGFTSSEEDSEDEEEKDGLPLDQLPEVKIDRKSKKALEAAKAKGNEDTPGTLYIGRIPHGFYEHQMRAYFSQFGDVINLRMAHNRKTGASKHYGFIQFDSGEVADIVAKTMNNYLMFGHILKVQRIPDEQVHPELWKNANRRFKKVPWAKIQGTQSRLPKGRDYWRNKAEKEEEKREKKRQAMKDMGYEFELPKLKRVDDVAMKEVEQDDNEENAQVAAQKTITDTPAIVDDVQVEVEKVLKKDGVQKKVKTRVTKTVLKV